MQAHPAAVMAGIVSWSPDMLLLAAKIAMAYLLGSLSGSLLVGRLRGLDIRQHGSGNAGGTNALRVAGWRFALAVVVIDVGKGVLAALLGYWQPVQAELPTAGLHGAVALCGFAAVLGHCWPVFFGFRGGKGAGTAVGVILVVAPLIAAMLFVVWSVVIVLTRYVGLATVSAALAFPCIVVGADLLGHSRSSALLPFAVGIAVLLVYTHRSNLGRLLRHEEPKLGRRKDRS